ncbi:MAG: invasin domain 3-containing protein [Balneolaceae bacterium]
MAQIPLYDTNFEPVNFQFNDATLKSGASSTSEGAIHLYEDVITLEIEDGVFQQIDAIVRTVTMNRDDFQTYDADEQSNVASQSDENWFMPLFGGGDGYTLFQFEFIEGGTYNNTTNTGNIVTLQNVIVNSFDIDGTGSGGTNQYTEFGGFSKSELSPTTKLQTIYNDVTGLTTFKSTVTTNNLANPGTVAGDEFRVRVTYDELSIFRISMGSDGGVAAYFGLQFAAGPQWHPDALPIISTAPSLDLNTAGTGIHRSVVFTGSPISFSAGGVNVTGTLEQEGEDGDPQEVGNSFDNLVIGITASEILDGASETIVISGASSGGSIPLNFTNGQSISNVSLDGTTYVVEAVVSEGEKRLRFTNNSGGTLSKTQAEALLDALQYQNDGSTGGSRIFDVTVRDESLQSPTANFTVTLSASELTLTTQPVGDASGEELATKPVVEIQDDEGDRIDYDNSTEVEVTITSGLDGELLGTTVVTAENGVVTYSDLGLAGLVGQNYVLTFSDVTDGRAEGDRLSSVESNTVTVTHGDASELVMTGGSSDLLVGVSRELTITIRDEKGNTVSSGPESELEVTFAKESGSGGVSGLGTETAENGVAALTVTGQSTGSVTLEGTIDSPSLESNTLTFTVVPGAPEAFVIESGAGQSGVVSQLLAESLVVKLTDEHDTPISGVDVSFSITSVPDGAADHELQNVAGTTDAEGKASADLRLGTVPGTYIVTASVDEEEIDDVTFTITATGLNEAPMAGLGRALEFDGSDDYLDLGSTGIIGSRTAFTLEAWVKLSDITSSHAIYGEFRDGDSLTRNYFQISNGTVVFDQWASGESLDGQTITADGVPEDEWTHVAYVRDGAFQAIYLNGVEAASNQDAETYSGSEPTGIAIGRRLGSSGGSNLNGALDELRLWSVARTAEEIAGSWNRKTDGTDEDLLAWYDFNEESGISELTDRSGNGWDGTLENFDTSSSWVASNGTLVTELREDASNGAQVTQAFGYDPDEDALAYSITGGNSGGVFAIDSNTGWITVANASALDYSSTTEYTLTVQVSDGSETDTYTLEVQILSAPVLATNSGLTVGQGASSVISSSRLESTDSGYTAAEITYTLESVPENGTLTLNGSTLAAEDTFTQDDIDNDRISYEHDASENLSDAFDFVVSNSAGTSLGSATFSITITEDLDPASLVRIGGSGQTGPVLSTLGDKLVVKVENSLEAPLEGVTVTFAITTIPEGAEDQELVNVVGTTNEDGEASVDLKLGTKTGNYIVTASIDEEGIDDVSFTGTATPGAANAGTTTLAVSPGSIEADGESTSTVTVTVRDENGNIRTAGGDDVYITASSGTLDDGDEAEGSAISAHDNGDGTYTVTLTSSSNAGTATVAAYLGADDEAPEIDSTSVEFTVGAVSAGESVVEATTPHTADGADESTVTIQVKDGSGNAITGLDSDDFDISLDNQEGSEETLVVNTDVWLRSTNPESVNEDDAASVRHSEVSDGPRYAIFEFDFSELDPGALKSAELTLKALNTDGDIGQDAFLIDTRGGTQASDMTWSAYQDEYEGNEISLEELGYQPPNTPGSAGDVVTMDASNPDLARIQNIVDSKGKLTIVLKPNHSSTNVDWYDDVYDGFGNGARLNLIFDKGDAAAGTVAETGTQGTYEFVLTSTLAKPVTVTVSADDVALEDTPEVVFQTGDISAPNSTVFAAIRQLTVGNNSEITVFVRDEYNNPITGLEDFDLSTGGSASIAEAISETDTPGKYTFKVTNTIPETVVIEVEAGSLELGDEEIVFTVGSADPASTVADVPDGTVGSETEITITVEDALENRVEGVAGDLTISITGANSDASFSTIEDQGEGVYTVSYTPAEQGEDEITISLNGTGITGSPYTSIVSGPPAAPSGVAAEAGNKQAEVTWEEPESDGGKAIIDYLVQYSVDDGETWVDFETEDPSTTRTRAVTGLANNRSYIFRVSAENSVGSGLFSEPSEEVIPAVPLPTPEDGESLPSLTPGSTLTHINGVPEAIVVEIVDKMIYRMRPEEGDDFSLALMSIGVDGEPIPISTLDSFIRLERGGDASIRIQGHGFMPGTVVTVWIFSDPILLGHIPVDDEGEFDGTLPIPPDLELGHHTLQVNGLDMSLQERSLSVGVIVTEMNTLANLEPPVISGTPGIGEDLTADYGEWSGEPEAELSMQWVRCTSATGGTSDCEEIEGETGETYEVKAVDAGSWFRVRVTGENGVHSPITVYSEPKGPVASELAILAACDSPCTLPDWTMNIPGYEKKMEPVGGVGPYEWSVSDGALPDGVILSKKGNITGEPTEYGDFVVTIMVRDATGATASREFHLTIFPDLDIIIEALPPGVSDITYGSIIEAEGGLEPYEWSVTDGALPDGLTLDTETGRISGEPLHPGSYEFEITLRDASGRTVSRTYRIDIADPGDLQLSFVFTEQPSATLEAGQTIGTVVVKIQNEDGTHIRGWGGEVTLSLTPGTGDPTGELLGTTTVSANNGVATFRNIRMERAGVDYTLTVSAEDVNEAVSEPFTVYPGPPWRMEIEEVTEASGDALAAAMEVGSGFFMKSALSENPVPDNHNLEGNRIPLYLIIYDEFDNETHVPEGDTPVALKTSTPTGRFYMAQTDTDPVDEVTIPMGQSRFTFYYEDPTAGNLVLDGTPTPPPGARRITPGQRPIQIRMPGKLLASPAEIVTQIYTREAVTVRLVDANGETVRAPNPGVTVTLGTSTQTGRFYRSASGGEEISSIIILPAESSRIVYYEDFELGTHTLNFNGAGVPDPNDTALITIGAGPADLNRTEAVVPDGMAGEQTMITIHAYDQMGNPVTGAADVFELEVTEGSNPESVFSEVTDNGDGTYTVFYTPALTGADHIAVRLNGEMIGGSTHESRIGPFDDELFQNFPNPFMASTTISYSVSGASEVRLTIYDILGRPVVLLVDEPNQAPGSYHIEWVPSSAGISSGTYLYRLIVMPQQGDQYKETKKLLFIR